MNAYAKQKQTHRYKSKFIVPKGERDKLGLWDRQIQTIIK